MAGSGSGVRLQKDRGCEDAAVYRTARWQFKLAEDVSRMKLDRLLSHEEGASDPEVTSALAQKGENIALTCGQIRDSIVDIHPCVSLW